MGFGRMAFGSSQQVFFPGIDDFDRAASGFPRQQGSMASNIIGIFFFAAKRATGHGKNNSDFIFGQSEQLHQRFMNIIRALH